MASDRWQILCKVLTADLGFALRRTLQNIATHQHKDETDLGPHAAPRDVTVNAVIAATGRSVPLANQCLRIRRLWRSPAPWAAGMQPATRRWRGGSGVCGSCSTAVGDTPPLAQRRPQPTSAGRSSDATAVSGRASSGAPTEGDGRPSHRNVGNDNGNGERRRRRKVRQHGRRVCLSSYDKWGGRDARRGQRGQPPCAIRRV